MVSFVAACEPFSELIYYAFKRDYADCADSLPVNRAGQTPSDHIAIFFHVFLSTFYLYIFPNMIK